MSMQIVECEVNFLSFERALKLTPPEFEIGYKWFQDREGQLLNCLPHRDKTLVLPEEIKICADRGIHSPSYENLASKNTSKRLPKYALSIHSKYSSSGYEQVYPDRDIILKADGTWTLDYCAHKTAEGRKETDKSNLYLMNNLIDGIPVAVLIQDRSGKYKNYGLAYVESFNPITNMFTLHGPVSAEATNPDFFSIIPVSTMTNEEKNAFLEEDRGDRRKRAYVEQVRRERQGAFRKALLDAYEGRCAVTSVDIPEVLQAAHIENYRGLHSQTVTNGLLLRSDIHLLYDSHLITVTPDNLRVCVSDSLQGTHYETIHDKQICIPRDPSKRPDCNLLNEHAKKFNSVEQRLLSA